MESERPIKNRYRGGSTLCRPDGGVNKNTEELPTSIYRRVTTAQRRKLIRNNDRHPTNLYVQFKPDVAFARSVYA